MRSRRFFSVNARALSLRNLADLSSWVYNVLSICSEQQKLKQTIVLVAVAWLGHGRGLQT